MNNLAGITALRQSAGPVPADVLMARHGVWNGPDIDTLHPKDRIEHLQSNDSKNTVRLSHVIDDPDGIQILTFSSQTTLDLKNGTLEDSLVIWHSQGGTQRENTDQYALASRYRLAPEEEWPDGVPSFYPEQIWVNGITIHHAEHQDFTTEQRAKINRFIEFNQRFKEGIINKAGIEYFANLVHGDGSSGHFAKAAFGEEPFLKGINAKGWDPFQRIAIKYLSGLTRDRGEPPKLTFTLPSIPSFEARDRLKDVHGLNINSLEPRRSMENGRSKMASNLADGIGYVTRANHVWDEETQRHVFNMTIAPQDIPEGLVAGDPYELIRLEYSEGADGIFTLEKAQMNEGDPKDFEDPSKSKRLVAAMEDSCKFLAKNEFPPYRDILFRHGLFQHWHELPPPADEFESLWVSLYGCETERPVIDNFGLGVGSTQYFMNRRLEKNGQLDEVDACFDITYESGNQHTEHEGAQPDILFRKEALERGFIFIGHGHYDHNTLENFAKMVDKNGEGWMRGIDVVLKEYDYYTIRHHLKSLKVAQENWPNFICYDTPEALNKYPDRLKKIDEHNFSYRHFDEHGNTRFFAQIIKHGAYHTALSDMVLLTPCFIPADPSSKARKIHPTYLVAGDYAAINDHAKPTLRRGQLALADIHEDITEDELMAVVPDKDHLYIALMEATSSDKSGYSTKTDEFKDTFRKILRAFPEDKIPLLVGFSTNHLEYQAILEVFNEPEFLRHVVAVNASAEHRLTAMNNHIVNPDLDLSKVVIPHDKLPQIAYDVAFEAINKYVEKIYNQWLKKSQKSRNGKTLAQMLSEDVRYQIFKYVLDEAQKEIKAGNTKPFIIFETFFNGKRNAMEEYARALGFPEQYPPRSTPNIVRNAIADKRIELRKNSKNTLKITEEFESDKNLTDSDVKYWVMRSLEKYGRIKFDPSRDLINQQNMYNGIMRGQDEISVRRTRGAKSAKIMRSDLDKLAIFTTGPIGSLHEYFSGLSCLFRGDGLFDASRISRSTGFQVRAENMIPIVLQPASMGSDAQMSKDAMLEAGARRRRTPIIDMMSSGFNIHNAGQYRDRFIRRLSQQGCRFDPYQNGTALTIANQNGHIEGHAHYQDKLEIYESEYLKARLIENVHIAGIRTLEAEREIIERTGRKTSIKAPSDWTARKMSVDQDGHAHMEDVAHLTPRLRLVDKISKFGRMFGWEIQMKLALGLARRGSNRSDTLSIRDLQGDFSNSVAMVPTEGFLKPYDGSHPYQDHLSGPRFRRMEPSQSEIQPTGGIPLSPMQAGLIAHAIKHRQPIAKILPPELA
jgi:hypothetical protein